MKKIILQTRNLTRRFGPVTAVDALNLAVEAGEVFGMVGPNGAGKTTTIKMLVTLLPPTEGTAVIAGADVVKRASRIRRMIGYVPQLLSADGSLTGYENLLVFSKLYDLPSATREQRIRDALHFMGLSDSADRLVRTYSGGMIRRLEIAQAVLHDPVVLFLDEPTVGLDPVARETVWEHVGRLSQKGTTIVMTTHYLDEADSLCDRVAIMNMGRVVAMDSPAALKASIGDPDATLDKVFEHYVGNTLTKGGEYRDVSRVRRTARRLG